MDPKTRRELLWAWSAVELEYCVSNETPPRKAREFADKLHGAIGYVDIDGRLYTSERVLEPGA